jgi:general secretion pathway protein N
MRAPGLASLGLAAYAVFLVATVPAAWVAAQLQASLPGRIAMSDVRGTLWRGEARVRISPPRAGVVQLDHLDWRFAPSRLLAGEVAFQAQAKSAGMEGAAEIARGFAAWHARSVKVEGDAAGLATLIPLAAPWRPGGAIALSSPEVEIREREVRGSLEVDWRNAVTGLSEVKPLGSYRLTWRGDGGAGTLEVTTVKGPLRIAGKGTTAPRFAFSGEARGEGEAARALEPLLDLMGPRRPDGARALELRLN